jgi:hypothetical protein
MKALPPSTLFTSCSSWPLACSSFSLFNPFSAHACQPKPTGVKRSQIWFNSVAKLVKSLRHLICWWWWIYTPSTVHCTVQLWREKSKIYVLSLFHPWLSFKKSKLIGICTVILFVSVSAIFGTCTVVDLNGTLVVDKMFTFNLNVRI